MTAVAAAVVDQLSLGELVLPPALAKKKKERPLRAVYRARAHMVKEDAEGLPDVTVHGPDSVADLMHALYDDSPQEVFVVFHLNTRHKVVGFEEITRGTIDCSLIHPRDVFRSAILANAAGIIVSHNHPSGDPAPSPEDRAVTRNLGAAAKVIGIPVIDHVIIGAYGGQYSFAESAGFKGGA